MFSEQALMLGLGMLVGGLIVFAWCLAFPPGSSASANLRRTTEEDQGFIEHDFH